MKEGGEALRGKAIFMEHFPNFFPTRENLINTISSLVPHRNTVSNVVLLITETVTDPICDKNIFCSVLEIAEQGITEASLIHAKKRCIFSCTECNENKTVAEALNEKYEPTTRFNKCRRTDICDFSPHALYALLSLEGTTIMREEYVRNKKRTWCRLLCSVFRIERQFFRCIVKTYVSKLGQKKVTQYENCL